MSVLTQLLGKQIINITNENYRLFEVVGAHSNNRSLNLAVSFVQISFKENFVITENSTRLYISTSIGKLNRKVRLVLL